MIFFNKYYILYVQWMYHYRRRCWQHQRHQAVVEAVVKAVVEDTVEDTVMLVILVVVQGD